MATKVKQGKTTYGITIVDLSEVEFALLYTLLNMSRDAKMQACELSAFPGNTDISLFNKIIGPGPFKGDKMKEILNGAVSNT